ncbi:MAG: hypothetical protein HY866_00270 [Chloroflexi bacterium]|nr:hypothetical protein [Chloroflexota bacterium]
MITSQKAPLHRFVPLGVFLLLGLSSVACVNIANRGDGFNVAKNYELKSGKQLDGDQVIVAYDVDLQPGSSVNGDLTLTGNQVTFGGEVTGDAVIVADQLTIGDEVHVTGDMVICADSLTQSDTARIEGEFKKECGSSRRVSVSHLIESGWDSWRGSLFFRMSTAVIGSLLLAALSALVTAAIPRPLARMVEGVHQAPISVSGMGFVTILMVIGMTMIYIVSLQLILPVILLPVVMLGWLAVGLLSLFGWIALAGPLGRFVLRLLHVGKQPPMVAAAVGGLTLGLGLRIWSVFWLTAWIGLAVTVIVASIGLGAVILTRIGTRPYPTPVDRRRLAVQDSAD